MGVIYSFFCVHSEISEQYVIPSLGNMGPVLELRRMPKSTSLIIGHDGEGGFCLWYALVSQFCHLYCAVPKGIIAVTVDVVVIFVRDLVSASRMLHASYIQMLVI